MTHLDHCTSKTIFHCWKIKKKKKQLSVKTSQEENHNQQQNKNDIWSKAEIEVRNKHSQGVLTRNKENYNLTKYKKMQTKPPRQLRQSWIIKVLLEVLSLISKLSYITTEIKTA